MKELNARLKSGSLDKAYLFFGTESYLIRAYGKRLVSAIFSDDALAEDMNINVFEGEKIYSADIIAACEAVPFGADKRLVILKNTGLFHPDKKDNADNLADYVKDMPDSTIVLFRETIKPPDKRVKLYKSLSAVGSVWDFATPPEGELVIWLTRVLAAENVSISATNARILLRQVCGGADSGVMDLLHSEALKLAAYKGTGGVVTPDDIALVCVHSIEGKIFSLVKEIGMKSPTAITSLSNLLASKEAPLMILSMIARQFRLILICKGLRDKGTRPADIARAAGLRDFMVDDFLRQGANFSQSALASALQKILSTEFSIKSGKMSDRLSLETLIFSLISA